MTNLKRTTSADPDFQNLVALLDEYLGIIDGDEHAFYAQLNKIHDIKNAIVYFQNNEAVGCGAFKQYDAGTVEIKRMYVKPGYRRKGIAAQILKELEKWAAEINYSLCILETGKKQPDAIALYKKSGYTQTPNFGKYEHVENSVCMKKPLI